MTYDKTLAQRMLVVLDLQPGLVIKNMFGGVAFMLQGNLACGVLKDEMIVRVGPQRHQQALSQPYTRPFDFSGHPMNGWIMVTPEGCKSDDEIQAWVQQGIDFALSLPAK